MTRGSKRRINFYSIGMARQRLPRELKDLELSGEFNVRQQPDTEDVLLATIVGPGHSVYGGMIEYFILP